MAGVSGNTIGQWARWGYIRASQSDGDPHVYSVEDVTEAAIVHDLLEAGIRPAHPRPAARALAAYGACPRSEPPLAPTTNGGPPLLVLRADDGVFAMGPRG